MPKPGNSLETSDPKVLQAALSDLLLACRHTDGGYKPSNWVEVRRHATSLVTSSAPHVILLELPEDYQQLFQITLAHWEADGSRDVDSIVWIAAPREKALLRFLSGVVWFSLVDLTLHRVEVTPHDVHDSGVDYVLNRWGGVVQYNPRMHARLQKLVEERANNAI